MMENKKGFTLIELLVVIAIIGVLASVVLVALNSSRPKARDARRRADLRQIANAVELYYSDNGVYPGANYTTYYWIDDNNYPGSSGFPPCATSGGLAPYISNICNVFDPQGNPYAYAMTTDGYFKLGARFELTANQGTPFTYNLGTSVSGWYEPK